MTRRTSSLPRRYGPGAGLADGMTAMYRNHLEKLSRTRLDDVLVDEGVLDRARLEAAQAEQDQTGRLLSDILIDSSTVDEWDLAKLLVTHYALPFVDVTHYSISGPVLDILPLDWCRTHSVLPIDQFGRAIALACAEVPAPEVVQEIWERCACTVFVYVGVRRAIRDVIDENLKRRAAAPGQSMSVFGGMPSRTGDASVSMAEEELPPLDIPRVSLQLDASAAQVVLAPSAPLQLPPRRAQIERFGRSTTGASAPHAPAFPVPGAVTPAAKAKSKSSSATDDPPPVVKTSAMQQLLGRAAVAPSPPQHTEEPVRPRLSPGRVAPVLPTPPKPAAAAAAAKPAAAGGGGGPGWESIFDIGDDAVRRSQPDDGE